MSYLPDKLFPLSVPDAPVEAVRFTPDLRGLIAFCESKPAEEGYCYDSTGSCLIAQLYVACGYPDVRVGNFFVMLRDNCPPEYLGQAMRSVAECEPHTFAAALQRARAAL